MKENIEHKPQRHSALDAIVAETWRNETFRAYLINDFKELLLESDREIQGLTSLQNIRKEKARKRVLSAQIRQIAWDPDHVQTDGKIRNALVSLVMKNKIAKLSDLGNLPDDLILGEFGVGVAMLSRIREKFPFTKENNS